MLHDDSASRVSRVKVTSTVVAEYAYLGGGSVVGVLYPEIDVMSNRFGSSAGSEPDLDRFNRVTMDRWTKDVGAGLHLDEADLTDDRNSNALWRIARFRLTECPGSRP